MHRDRNPLCARCRMRHKAHTAVAYLDEFDDKWRCLGCDALLDADGECNTPKCCGNRRLGFAVGKGYRVVNGRGGDGDDG